MNISKKIKINNLMVLLIVFMILGLLLVGLTGIRDTKKTTEAISRMNSQTGYLLTLSDLRTQTRANFANIVNIMLEQTPEERQKVLDNYNTRLEKIDTDYKSFTPHQEDTEEIKQYQLIETNMNSWKETSDKILDFVEAGDVDSAQELFKSIGEEQFETLQTSIRDMIGMIVKESDEVYVTQYERGQELVKELKIFMAVIIVILVMFGVIIIRSISRPLNKTLQLIDKTANLDLTADDSFDALLVYKNEFGRIASAIIELRKQLRGFSGKIIEISSTLAAGSEELAATASENVRTINQVVNAVNEIARGNSDQAEVVERTGVSVKEMADIINDVNNATSETSNNVRHSIDMVAEGRLAVNTTVDKIKMNSKVTDDVGEAIKELSNQMDEVKSIINVINEISQQTNLLSLNASIEAARAGDAGKGFAVVASEIGMLANETAEAAKKITEIINITIDKNVKTADNNTIAKNIGIEQEKSISVMVSAFNNINNSIQDIKEQTGTISQQMNHINDLAVQIADQTTDLSAAAEEAAATSEEISASNEEQLASIEMIAASTDDIARLATELSAEISKFKI